MEQFIGFLLLVVFTEGIITYVNNFIVSKEPKWQQVASLIIGELMAFGYAADLLALFGLDAKIPYLGIVMSGIVISRGSNYVFDLIKKLIKVAQGGSDIVTLEETDDGGLG